MKRYLLILLLVALTGSAFGVDMQAPMTSTEAQDAYSTYLTKQAAYYTGQYSPANLRALCGSALFERLNALMGATNKIKSGYSYDKLKDAYASVERDLNKSGYIIGSYDGASFSSTWDSGKTWNREHTWPQSKGAKDNCLHYDIHQVRPTHTSVNGKRGNMGFGTGNGYYDPDDVSISNPLYRAENNGSYRGDVARIILYCYITYGEKDGYKNSLYTGTAQLLSKVGTPSTALFESINMLIAWSEADPPSLTEMVRNDGAQDYQGNRNPFIDYPELVRALFSTTPPVTGVDENSTSATDAHKVLYRGQIYIVENGVTYDLYGRRMGFTL